MHGDKDNDLPGMLAVAKGVAEQKFPHTMDAKVWAEEFMKLVPLYSRAGLDEGDLIGWFANAIMAGYDMAQSRLRTEEQRIKADGYVAQVPDKCDRITWRGRYYHLSSLQPQRESE